MNGVARRVFDAVPIKTPWGVAEIHNEIVRSGHSRMDIRVLQGCLRALVDTGLVRERQGLFVRTAVRVATPAANDNTTSQPDTPMPAIKQDPTALEQLAILADQARKMAKDLQAYADMIDTVALNVDKHIEQSQAGAAKLRQLQSLLKDLT